MNKLTADIQCDYASFCDEERCLHIDPHERNDLCLEDFCTTVGYEATCVPTGSLRVTLNLPCGHPRGCIVLVPYIGEMKSNSCGWCAAEAKAKHFQGVADDLVELQEATSQDRDALREKLASIRHIVVTGHRVSLVDLSE